MQSTDTRKAPPGGRKQECCTDDPCDSGLRNRYFEGKRLTADSFQVEQSYLLERRRLLNRAIHGWGVVYGYAMKPGAVERHHADDNWGRIEIGPGLALDACGRELLFVHTASIGFDDVILLDDKGKRIDRPPKGSYQPRAEEKGAGPQTEMCWLLSAHYAEQSVDQTTIADPCSCERREWDRICETVRFSLTRIDCTKCCAPFDCELACGCGTGPCCEHHSHDDPAQPRTGQYASDTGQQRPAGPLHRGGCKCLCEHLTGLSDTHCGRLCEIDERCAHIRVDMDHGVPLACVRLREGDCDNWLFDSWIEACGPRRLVKRNDVLFDLIRGCDLTRISGIGWADWHRSAKRIEFDQFQLSFGKVDPLPAERRSKQKPKRVPVVTQNYWVEFSRPVRKETVRTDCFSMTVIIEEDEGGWDEPHRVPILGVHTSAPPGTPEGLITRATLMVDAAWVRDAVRGENTLFDEHPATVEIEIRGDFIVDCNGQTVDANAHGLTPAPTGNGTPGGSFISIFRLQPSYEAYRVTDENEDYTQGGES